MIKTALRNPIPHRDDLLTIGQTPKHIRGGLTHFGFAGPQQFLQHASVGMRAGTDFVEIDAHWLTPPKVNYLRITPRGGKGRAPPSDLTVRNARWNLEGATFFNTTNKMDELLVVELRDAKTRDLPDTFYPTLKTQLHLHGVASTANIPDDVRRCFPYSIDSLTSEWEKAFEDSMRKITAVKRHLTAQENGKEVLGPTVLVVMKHESYDDYACIKRVGDLKLGINTVCIVRNKHDQLSGPKHFNLQKASNVALKFNVKAANYPHQLNSTSLLALKDKGTSQADTIVLGADVAHPSKGCLDGTPSVAAVVGTIDNDFMLYQGSMRLQRGRKEEIGNLQGMVFERVLSWALKHGNKLPKKILFYRDGVSESQYDMVRTREIPQIQNAMNEADNALKQRLQSKATRSPPDLPFSGVDFGKSDSKETKVKKEAEAWQTWATEVADQRNNYPCEITFVVVGKRHNTRFYATSNKDVIGGPPGQPDKYNSNVKPGLAVDRKITHPSSMDFYLQSHEPIKGTGRSAHYFVIQNGMGLSIDQLQDITHTFCYAYARATRGVSYCAPAYYADRLCDRGRAYIRHFMVGAETALETYVPANIDYPFRRKNQGETHLDYMEAHAKHVGEDRDYFRCWRVPGALPMSFGRWRMNPWHRDLNTTMFWL